MTSCGGDDEEGGSTQKVTPLPKMDNISLSYHASVETVTLARDVQAEGATVSLKKGVSWINNIQLSGKIISFDVEENTIKNEGHRFDTLVIAIKGRIEGCHCDESSREKQSLPLHRGEG